MTLDFNRVFGSCVSVVLKLDVCAFCLLECCELQSSAGCCMVVDPCPPFLEGLAYSCSPISILSVYSGKLIFSFISE